MSPYQQAQRSVTFIFTCKVKSLSIWRRIQLMRSAPKGRRGKTHGTQHGIKEDIASCAEPYYVHILFRYTAYFCSKLMAKFPVSADTMRSVSHQGKPPNLLGYWFHHFLHRGNTNSFSKRLATSTDENYLYIKTKVYAVLKGKQKSQQWSTAL